MTLSARTMGLCVFFVLTLNPALAAPPTPNKLSWDSLPTVVPTQAEQQCSPTSCPQGEGKYTFCPDTGECFKGGVEDWPVSGVGTRRACSSLCNPPCGECQYCVGSYQEADPVSKLNKTTCEPAPLLGDRNGGKKVELHAMLPCTLADGKTKICIPITSNGEKCPDYGTLKCSNGNSCDPSKCEICWTSDGPSSEGCFPRGHFEGGNPVICNGRCLVDPTAECCVKAKPTLAPD
jgi:hypothetical protein